METHALWPKAHQRWAAAVVRLGLLLAWKTLPDAHALAEVWEREVMPRALSREILPCPLKQGSTAKDGTLLPRRLDFDYAEDVVEEEEPGSSSSEEEAEIA